MIRDWSIINRERIGDFKLFSLTQKKVRSPRTGEIREVQALHFSDWVLILALTPQEKVVMVRQYRHGTEQVCLELPGGLVDPADDSPELSARRELLEETGYEADEITFVGECCPQPAILTNKCFFYLAPNAVRVKTQTLDAGEDIEILEIPLKEIPPKIKSSEIDHGMVLLAFFFFWMKQGRIG
ncbi:MAG: NUDIX hydrolase [Desulfobacterales bacterium]|jgi:8-oxo-dGTP pyrophosphatase MutT (NUDIX family)